jgi:putative ABC transport system substrate-binding protein
VSGIRRRDFVILLGGGATAAWPLAGRAQQKRVVPVIGVLSSRSPAVDRPLIAIIRDGLREGGFVDGQNVALDYHWTEGEYDRLASLAADLVRQRVAVIVAIGGDQPALAAKAATATIPIGFVSGADPIQGGLVTSLNRPGGNVTGVASFIAQMEAKRLELLRELRPDATVIAVLVNPGLPQAEIQVSDVQTAARSVGQDIMILNARSIREINAAFATLAKIRAEALLVTTDPLFFTRATQLVVLAARHGIPTLYSRREFAAAGGLASYGPNTNDDYRVVGGYAARILKGERPGDLPIQQSAKFELVINVSTATALNFQIPDKLLALANEVIE